MENELQSYYLKSADVELFDFGLSQYMACYLRF
jgi:hypothetical protein